MISTTVCVCSMYRPAPTKRYNSSYGYADALRAGAQGPANVATARGAAAAAVSGLGERLRS